MSKTRALISILLIITLSISGCSNAFAKNSTDTSSVQMSVMLGDPYETLIEGQSFYCIRVNGDYYKLSDTDFSADLLTAEDPSLLPVLEDGQFAKVTADLRVIASSFGYVPIVTIISTEITDLKAFEPVEFEDIAEDPDLPSADSEEISSASNLFQYTYEGNLYLIFVYDGHVTAYSKDGLFIDYERFAKENKFNRFFEHLKD